MLRKHRLSRPIDFRLNHNDAVATIEGAVAFYNGDAFNNSPAGQLLSGATGSGIRLDVTQVEAVSAFLRVINALENLRQTLQHLEASLSARPSERARRLLSPASAELDDAIRVLVEPGCGVVTPRCSGTD